MVSVRIIGKQNEGDINIKNEPFLLFGKLTVSYNDGKWSCETHIFAPDAAEYMCFPDEGYCFDDMAKDSVFIGAYDYRA